MDLLLSEFNIQLQTPSQASLKKQLADKINYLIEHDFYSLVQLLYRIDINETTLKETLHNNTGLDSGLLIADLVIERQLEKAALRKQFKQQNDIAEEDKW